MTGCHQPRVLGTLIILIAGVFCTDALAQRILMSKDKRPAVPEEYLVEDGDTLWDVCDYYFGEPRRWPTVWALNPHITNPHWIYPGDVLRLSMPNTAISEGMEVNPFTYTIGAEGARQVSISEGFVVEKGMDARGKIAYSPHTQTYLALDDLVYLTLDKLNTVRVGQKFSVYEVQHDVIHPETDEVVGQKIRIKGIVEIESVEKHMARARITSSFGEMTRGMPVIDLLNHYVEVAPRQNLVNMKGTVLDALTPSRELGQFDTIFIDRGAKDGVQLGNRFFVMRRGDGRFEYELEINKKMPWEQIGEALIVLTRDNTSTALITRSALEVRRGDRVIMQRHY